MSQLGNAGSEVDGGAIVTGYIEEITGYVPLVLAEKPKDEPEMMGMKPNEKRDTGGPNHGPPTTPQPRRRFVLGIGAPTTT